MVLDNCDGEIARAKNMKSPFGAWLDIGADALTDILLFTGLAIGMLRRETQGPILWAYVLSLSGLFMHFVIVVFEKLKGFGPAEFNRPNPEGSNRKNPIFTLFNALSEGDVSLVIVLFAVFNAIPYLLWFGAIYMQILWISALVLNLKWLVQRRPAS